MKLLKVEDVIKTIDYIKKQTGYEGDIFLNVNVNAIPIEFIEEQIAKTTDINNKEEMDVFYAGHLGYLLKLWEKENADL